MAQYTVDLTGMLTSVQLEPNETTFTLPTTVNKVAARCFTSTTNIRELVTSGECELCSGCFYKNNTIKTIYLAANVTVDSGMFAYGNTLEALVLGEGNTYNFRNNVLLDAQSKTVLLGTNQEEIIIPEGVISISSKAFSGCYGIKRVIFPSTLEEIGDYAFCDCIGLEELKIPRKVSRIGVGAFLGCANVLFINIGEGSSDTIESTLAILSEQFGDNVRLSTIKIPYYVNYINDEYGRDAFHNVYNIERCIVDKDYEAKPKWRIRAKSYPNGTEPITVTFDPHGGICSELTKLVYIGTPYGLLPEAYGNIGHGFVGWYNNDEEITENTVCWESAPHTLTAKWRVLDYTITFLTSDGSIFETVTAPYGSQVSIPETHPPHSEGEDNYRFIGWLDSKNTLIDSSKPIEVQSDAEYRPKYWPVNFFSIIVDGTEAIITGISQGLEKSDIGEVCTIPRFVERYGVNYTITGIANSAFKNDKRIEKIIVEDGLSFIGDEAFAASSLTEISLPNSMERLGQRTFWNCTSLTKVVGADYGVSIDIATFEGASSLISIPPLSASLTKIEIQAFYGCSNLRNVYMLSTYDENHKIEIGPRAFAFNTRLESINTAPITKIEDEAFHSCTQLTTINNANQEVDYIGNYTFFNTPLLRDTISIGNMTHHIGIGAFDGYNTEHLTQPITGLYLLNGWLVLSQAWENPDVTDFDLTTIASSMYGIAGGIFNGGEAYFANLHNVKLPIGDWGGGSSSGGFLICKSAFLNFSHLSITYSSDIYLENGAFENIEDLIINCPNMATWFTTHYTEPINNTIGFQLNITVFGDADYLPIQLEGTTLKIIGDIPNMRFANVQELVINGIAPTTVEISKSSSAQIHIGEKAFYNCPWIQQLILSTDAIIDSSAFDDTIPDIQVVCTNVSEWINRTGYFSGLTGVALRIQDITTPHDGYDGYLHDEIGSTQTIHGVCLRCKNSIPSEAFVNLSKMYATIDSDILPVLRIEVGEDNGADINVGQRAFYNCGWIYSVWIHENVSISDEAFRKCGAEILSRSTSIIDCKELGKDAFADWNAYVYQTDIMRGCIIFYGWIVGCDAETMELEFPDETPIVYDMERSTLQGIGDYAFSVAPRIVQLTNCSSSLKCNINRQENLRISYRE